MLYSVLKRNKNYYPLKYAAKEKKVERYIYNDIYSSFDGSDGEISEKEWFDI